MGVVVRTTKNPSGGKTWASGDTIEQAALEDEIASIITQVENIEAVNLATDAVETAKIKDGAVTNAKVSATAAIALSKLDDSADAGIGANAIDDHGDNEATYTTIANPVNTGTSSLPTTLEEELTRLRYVIKRMGLGTTLSGEAAAGDEGAQLVDGTTQAAWYDGNAIGPNLLQNGSFLDNSASGSAPFGWDLVGTPNAIATAALPAAEGYGNAINVVDAVGDGGLADEGFDQTMSGLKDSTVYLVEARVLPTTDIVKLVTTGAVAGSYTDLDLRSGSGTGVWETLSGLIMTDAAATNIEIQLLSNATDYDFSVAWVSLREVASFAPNSVASVTNPSEGTAARGGNIIVGGTSEATGALSAVETDAPNSTLRSDTTVHVVVPDDGYQIMVWGMVLAGCDGNGDNDEWFTSIEESTDAFASETVVQKTLYHSNNGGMEKTTAHMHYANTAPTPGETYSYRLSAADTNNAGVLYGSATAGEEHRITVMLMRMG